MNFRLNLNHSATTAANYYVICCQPNSNEWRYWSSRLQWTHTHGLKSLESHTQTFPSPVLTRTSMPYTSWTSNSHFSWSFLAPAASTHTRQN